MRALIRRQPVAQADQARCGCVERANLSGDFTILGNAQAGNNGQLVHVKGATAWV
jgi:hypothetical protein